MSAGSFSSVPMTYRFRRFGRPAWHLQVPRAELPYWRFEAYGDQRWGNAASTASVVIEDFIDR